MGKFADIALKTMNVEIHVEFEKTSKLNPNKPHVVVCNDDSFEVHLIHVTDAMNGEEIEECSVDVVKAISKALKEEFPEHTYTTTPPADLEEGEVWKPVVKLRSFYNKLVFNSSTTRSYTVGEARKENTIYLHTFDGVLGKDKVTPNDADGEKYHPQWFEYLNKIVKQSK